MNISNKFLQRACENIYDYAKQKDGLVNKQSFLEDLKIRGLLTDDQRLAEFVEEINRTPNTLPEDLFVSCISRNISVIENSFTNNNVIYDFE